MWLISYCTFKWSGRGFRFKATIPLCPQRTDRWHWCTVEYSNWMMGQCTGTFYFGTCDFLIGRRRSMMMMIESFKLEINQRPRDYYHIVLTLPQSHQIPWLIKLLLFTFNCSYVSGYLLNGWHLSCTSSSLHGTAISRGRKFNYKSLSCSRPLLSTSRRSSVQ